MLISLLITVQLYQEASADGIYCDYKQQRDHRKGFSRL